MDGNPDISVVVASYNRCAGLERLLCALAVQTYAASRFEVIVVDDGSTDGTGDLLATIAVPYTLRGLSQENRGPAAARNLGVQHARGRLILFLDDDVLPDRGLLAAHELAHGHTINRVVIGPMLPPPTCWKQPAWDRWDAEQLQKQYRAMLARQFECSPRQFYTANASVHRVSFQANGGFDEAFRRAEDVELAWRMSRHGAEFRFEPGARVVHYAARTFRSWCRNAYQYGRYDVVMERENALPTFQLACREFHGRRAPNRWLTWHCVGHTSFRKAALHGLAITARLADAVSTHRISSWALSSIFNVLYWQGARDELGGSVPLRAAIAAAGAPYFSNIKLQYGIAQSPGDVRARVGMGVAESHRSPRHGRTGLIPGSDCEPTLLSALDRRPPCRKPGGDDPVKFGITSDQPPLNSESSDC